MEDGREETDLPSFGRYQAFRLLGEGATASVFLAKDPHLSRRVAIKVIKPQLLENESVLTRFRAEAGILANLRHPNILQVHDYDMEEDSHYLVMEYVEGPGFQSLLNRFQGRPMPQEVAAYFVRQAALGLAAAHKQGLVHRDIKPDNMLIAADGTLKIADFGIAHIADLNLTQAGDVLGTPYYMAPEQTLAEPPVAQTDLWALGVVLYYCLTGTRPFEGSNLAEIKRAIRLGAYTPIPERAPSVDVELVSMVDGLLSQEPERRGTAQSLALRLKELLDRTGIKDWDAYIQDFLAQAGLGALDKTTVEFQAAVAAPTHPKSTRWKDASSRSAPAAPETGYPFRKMAMAWVFPICLVVGINVYIRWNTAHPPIVQPKGILEIRSAPPGAGIMLDGDELGLTPLTQTLNTGRYRIKLTHPAFPGQVVDTTVRLEQGITKVNFRFKR